MCVSCAVHGACMCVARTSDRAMEWSDIPEAARLCFFVKRVNNTAVETPSELRLTRHSLCARAFCEECLCERCFGARVDSAT